jgi:hypothetical protein
MDSFARSITKYLPQETSCFGRIDGLEFQGRLVSNFGLLSFNLLICLKPIVGLSDIFLVVI